MTRTASCVTPTGAGAAALAFAEARAPRYTSYPTAVQFGPEVDEPTHRAWLAEVPTEWPVSLYLHVPFCKRLCWYCGCNTRVVNRREPVAAYVDLLEREIGLVGDALGGRRTVSGVHLGGGSPDALEPEDVHRLFEALATRFEIAPDAEIAAELDPTHLTRAWIEAAAACGLNRASLGVQDFSPKVQAAINRPQSFDCTAEAVAALRAAGVRSLNLDLLYGLPHQRVEDVRRTVELALRLRPDRVAVFGYAHVPWMKAHQKLIDAAALPGAAERLEQSEAAAEALAAAGYVAIGLDHFALPADAMAVAAAEGRLRRNFQGYTTDEAQTLIGLGASSISRLPAGFVQNQSAVRDWRAAVTEERLPTARGVEFIGDDQLRADAIERLMCDFRLDMGEVCAARGFPLEALASAWEPLTALEAQGLVALDGVQVVVTPAGRPLVRTVCTAFDRYFDGAAGRHAKAV